nr:hypothetical protein [uncultured Niameybacter sp.]
MVKKNRNKQALIEEIAKQRNINLLKEKLKLTRKYVDNLLSGSLGNVVFISVSNGVERAIVRHEKGCNFIEAWNRTQASIENYIRTKNYKPEWVKIDFVVEQESVPTKLLKKQIRQCEKGFFRKGIALDEDFQVAYLECELNSRRMIDYKKGEILIDQLSTKQEEVIVFNHKGFFCDENNEVYELHCEEKNFGRRIQNDLDSCNIYNVIQQTSLFLVGLQQSNGAFIYGYWPIQDKIISSYNILRHIGTVWGLISSYKITGDKSVLKTIYKGIHYALEHAIVYKTKEIAYIIERKNNELKLGGNGIMLLALIDSKELFPDEDYIDLMRALGNGILTYLDSETGHYNHVFNYPDYSIKDEFRTIYYDGEATFALLKLYNLTKEDKWLYAAKKAVENFIKQDYTKYRDHWIAYSMNELIKCCPEGDYIEFTLRNLNVNLDKINNHPTIYATYLELLMATYSAYQNICSTYKSEVFLDIEQEKYFYSTIENRVSRMLNGYYYPEYAMYMKKPSKIHKSIFIRNDKMRVRIDDIQHFLGGYCQFYLGYK